ncbi:cysteine proteinase-like [Helicoverpa zea]|uniref:cysteine proteinase-like n=1 Tax=Helicoverpa zea TaxID=7113 RepID=UPI001F569D2C|nr:cysteine proteinase-like [Helicoverpa zea]
MHSISIVLLFALVAIASAGPARPDKEYYDLAKAPEYFEKFIKDYNRKYKDAADREVHYQAFVKALAKSNKLNELSDMTTFGITPFSDYTEEEWKRMVSAFPIVPQNQ